MVPLYVLGIDQRDVPTHTLYIALCDRFHSTLGNRGLTEIKPQDIHRAEPRVHSYMLYRWMIDILRKGTY